MNEYYELLGDAKIDVDILCAGSLSIFKIIYEVGIMGIDDTGEILVARRDVSDSDIPQFIDPDKEGYVSVYTDVDTKLSVSYIPDRYKRPWKSCISIRISEGYLKKGDKIYIQYGSMDGMGYRVQTFCENKHIFKVLVDNMGSGDFYEIEKSPFISIVSGYADKLEAVVPSIIYENECFSAKLRALDSWGNIAFAYNSKIRLMIDNDQYEGNIINGLGEISDISIKERGYKYPVIIEKINNLESTCNPIKVLEKADSRRLYWGDMHGQTSETVGTGTIDEYFKFAKDKSYLDFCAWQGNDFQITDEIWSDLNNKTKKYNKKDKFITYPGYEWSGNNPVGGDYNIYFFDEGEEIYRSSSWQIGLLKHHYKNRYVISDLFEQFSKRDDVIAIPHVGGRCANLDFLDSEFVKLIEIHSHHGTFEWLFKEALNKGYMVGVVATSDDHTGRPGLSYPTQKTSRGFVSFDVMGGYTAVYSKDLSRKSIWEALKKRHCYATTGQRILFEVKCSNAMMGDVITLSEPDLFEVDVVGTAPIEDVLIFKGTKMIYSLYEQTEKNDRSIRIKWGGLRSKTRSKKTKWDGTISISNGKFNSVTEKKFYGHGQAISKMSNQIIKLRADTSGDYMAVDLDVCADDKTTLNFNSNNINVSFEINDLREGRKYFEAGGVNQFVEAAFICREYKKEHMIKYKDDDIQPGINAYWAKVIQTNGHNAWSSPIFINYKKEE